MFNSKMFVSMGFLGALTALGLFVYLNEDLRNRVSEQLSDVLDTTGRLIAGLQKFAGSDEPQVNHIADRQAEAESQWAKLS